MADVKATYLQKCSDFACQPIPHVLELLESGQPLTVLDLSGKHPTLFKNRVQPMQVFALCEALYDVPGVQQLLLPYNNLPDMAAQAVARLVQVNTGVELVDLRCNDVTAKGVTSLVEVLRRPECGLKGLVLRGNPLGDEGAIAVADMLRVNTTLTRLDMGDTHVGIRGVIALANALTTDNQTLQCLDLEDPQIQPPQSSTLQHLCTMLASNAGRANKIQELSLAKHRLTDSQFEQLVVYGLTVNSETANSFTSLNLRANKLSPLAGPLLERLLTECPRITALNLAHNALGNDGALALARCLPYCPALRSIDVRSNNVGDPGLAAIAESLPMTQGLERLFVWGNAFGAGSSRAFRQALKLPGLRDLVMDIQPYEVDGEVMVAIKDV